MDLITRRKSALNSNKGTARGSKNSKTIEYAGDSHETTPKLLAASPIKVLTNAPLNALPILVRSDLQFKNSIAANKFKRSPDDICLQKRRRVGNYQIPKAPVAKRAVQVPHLSWGEMRGKLGSWDLAVTDRVRLDGWGS